MATLTVKPISLAGTDATLAAAAGGGDACAPGEHVFIRVKNAGGSPCTVTIDSVTASNYGSDDNVVVVVAATTGDVLIGPLPGQRFANTSTGLVNWTYSGVTSVTVGAFAG